MKDLMNIVTIKQDFRRKYRKRSRMEYCKLFGKSKFVWTADKRDKTQAEHAA